MSMCPNSTILCLVPSTTLGPLPRWLSGQFSGRDPSPTLTVNGWALPRFKGRFICSPVQCSNEPGGFSGVEAGKMVAPLYHTYGLIIVQCSVSRITYNIRNHYRHSSGLLCDGNFNGLCGQLVGSSSGILSREQRDKEKEIKPNPKNYIVWWKNHSF